MSYKMKSGIGHEITIHPLESKLLFSIAATEGAGYKTLPPPVLHLSSSQLLLIMDAISTELANLGFSEGHTFSQIADALLARRYFAEHLEPLNAYFRFLRILNEHPKSAQMPENLKQQFILALEPEEHAEDCDETIRRAFKAALDAYFAAEEDES